MSTAAGLLSDYLDFSLILIAKFYLLYYNIFTQNFHFI